MNPVFMPSARGTHQQAVMRAHDLLADLNLDGGEQIGVLGEGDNDGARELGKVAGGGDLALVGQAIDVGEIGPRHAEMLCRLVHALDGRLLIAGDPLGDHDGDVVGRFDDEELEGDVECDQLTLFQPELAWGLLRRLLGAHELGVGRDGACLQRLEGDVGRHQLGEGGGKPLGVGIFGVEHRAVIGLEDKGWTGGRARRGHQDRSDEKAKARAP